MPRNSLKSEELVKADVSFVGITEIARFLAFDVALRFRLGAFDVQSSFIAFCMR